MKKTIESVMTAMPHSIGESQPLAVAVEQMKKYSIRHLPVLKGGRIVGVLTDRDAKLASRFPGSESLPVAEAMTPDPYVVAPETLFAEVAKAMAEHKMGCAIVAVKEKPVGIFTAVDGLRLLSEVYR